MPAAEPPLLLDVPDRFETARLLARALHPGDGPALLDAVEEARAALHPWLEVGQQVQNPEDAEYLARLAWARYLQRRQFRFGLWRKSDGQLIGVSALHYADWAVPRFEIGGWVRPAVQRRGYALEASHGLVRFGFEALGAERLEARFDHRNEASRRLSEKLGFTFEGRLRHHNRALDGKLVDEVVYALLREEWL